MPLAAGLVLLSGALAAVQGRINGELGERLNEALLAALVSFGTGWLLLLLIAAFRRRTWEAVLHPRGSVQWWFFVGGFGGAFLVGASAAAAPVLGVALLTVGQVAGQTGGSLVVDHVGLGPAGRQDVSARRLLSAALALGAVVLATTDRPSGSLSVPLLTLMLLAGVAAAVQAAINGRLREASGDSFAAALVNFTTGCIGLGLGAAVLAVAGRLEAAEWPAEPWLYLGGPIGVFFIAVTAWAVKPLGVLRLVLLIVAGQLVGATLIDWLAPAPRAELTPATAVAAAITVFAVWVAGGDRAAGALRNRRRAVALSGALVPSWGPTCAPAWVRQAEVLLPPASTFGSTGPVDGHGRLLGARPWGRRLGREGLGRVPPTANVGGHSTPGGPISTEPRINDRIRVPDVRLVGPNGEQVGIVSIGDALRLAQEADLDLVEVAPMAKPPVCKLMDYGKFKYESTQKAREARRNQANVIIKEMKLRPKIDPHDYETKKGHVVRFLKAGDKVKITIMFRGREQSRPELGFRLLQRLAADVEDLGFVETTPKQDGRNMTMVIGPHKKKADAKAERDAEKAARPGREQVAEATAAEG